MKHHRVALKMICNDDSGSVEALKQIALYALETSSDQDRSLFETWAAARGYDLRYADGDTFFVPATQDAWETWQAALNS